MFFSERHHAWGTSASKYTSHPFRFTHDCIRSIHSCHQFLPINEAFAIPRHLYQETIAALIFENIFPFLCQSFPLVDFFGSIPVLKRRTWSLWQLSGWMENYDDFIHNNSLPSSLKYLRKSVLLMWYCGGTDTAFLFHTKLSKEAKCSVWIGITRGHRMQKTRDFTPASSITSLWRRILTDGYLENQWQSGKSFSCDANVL